MTMTSTSAIRLLVNGARGRMGARIVALAREDARFPLVAARDLDDSGSDESSGALAPGSVDAIIDFSSDAGVRQAAELTRLHGAALLVGTTALSPNSLDLLGVLARSHAVMIASNTSLGVAVLYSVAAEAARLLGAEFHIDIIESHHAAKRDAPSGTALRLRDVLRERGGVDVPADRLHCIRAGDIIGEHVIQFSGLGEILKISHSATNRDLFARGALRAAAWLHGQKPGMYTIEQSLGVK